MSYGKPGVRMPGGTFSEGYEKLRRSTATTPEIPLRIEHAISYKPPRDRRDVRCLTRGLFRRTPRCRPDRDARLGAYACRHSLSRGRRTSGTRHGHARERLCCHLRRAALCVAGVARVVAGLSAAI